MTTDDRPAEPKPLRVAAAGDVHCDESNRAQTEAAFAKLAGAADIVLLAGDLTTHGEPGNAAVLADACRDLDMPIFTVLGNHDWHADRAAELAAVLEEAGITVLDRDHARCTVRGIEVGVAGTKGFVGGFAGSFLPDFGEPLLREVYREAGEEVTALERGLEAISGSSCCTTPPPSRPCTVSRRGSLPSWAPTAWPPRSSATVPTSCSTDTLMRAPSRARSRACRCSTSPCR
jgi:hypothetical protein